VRNHGNGRARGSLRVRPVRRKVPDPRKGSLPRLLHSVQRGQAGRVLPPPGPTAGRAGLPVLRLLDRGTIRTTLPALPAGPGAPIMAPDFEEEGAWSE
jgi:hypothetical protein